MLENCIFFFFRVFRTLILSGLFLAKGKGANEKVGRYAAFKLAPERCLNKFLNRSFDRIFDNRWCVKLFNL